MSVAIQAMAGVLGGTQSLHTDSMDEALALPSEKAVQIALRTQQVIAHESGAANVIDPLGGSYYLEWLTDDMERQARDYFDRIESLGGVVPAIEKGFFQKEIASASYKYQKEIDNKERIVVGVNEFTTDEDVEIPILEMDPEGFERQCNRLKNLRKNRNQSKAEKSLTAIALLFAIYQYKPSPFCILDEVDAPLDDINISKFTKVIKDYSKNTQFIMVTHNKLTMESTDCIYGVTSEKKGISKVISIDFNEK